MFRHALLIAVMLSTLVGPIRASGQATLQDVESSILNLVEKQRSFTANVRMEVDVQEEDFQIRSTKTGTYEFAKKDRNSLYRQELEVNGIQRIDDEEMQFKHKEVVVCNGRHIYTLIDDAGQKSATMVGAQSSPPSRVDRALFTRWHAAYHLKLLADENVEGIPAWVIEAKPKSAGVEALPAKTLYHFSRADGIMIRRVQFDDQGKMTESTTFSNVRLNPELDEKRFEFTPPEGVEILDLTRDPKRSRSPDR